MCVRINQFRDMCVAVGPFLELDAEQVEEEVGTMWRTMHKLTRTFAEQPQPKRSAELYKMKLNEFKEHLPLLQTFCNQGLRDRHWQRVCEIYMYTDMVIMYMCNSSGDVFLL